LTITKKHANKGTKTIYPENAVGIIMRLKKKPIGKAEAEF